MALCAAVMTGPAVGAIATIGLFGESVHAVLEAVFRPAGGHLDLAVGHIVLGHIVDGAETVDQVTVGCEAEHAFAIHCHGNPLIVEAIMKLLQRHGVELLEASQWQLRRLCAGPSKSAIAIEAQVALTAVKTVEGAKLIAGQVEGGLGRWCRRWQGEPMSLDRIAGEVACILCDSDIAKRIVSGCRIVLAGPPNSGKSTLLNALAGREKAIVADIEGTTRDWVSAEIHIPPLAATVVDTAGLDVAACENEIDQAAQARSMEVLGRSDLVLLVLDAGRPVPDMLEHLSDRLNDKKVVVALNKADLPEDPEMTRRMPALLDAVRLSAKHGTGIDELIGAILRVLRVDTFDPHAPVAFTDRQRDLLARLRSVSSKTEAAAIFAELLEGPLSV